MGITPSLRRPRKNTLNVFRPQKSLVLTIYYAHGKSRNRQNQPCGKPPSSIYWKSPFQGSMGWCWLWFGLSCCVCLRVVRVRGGFVSLLVRDRCWPGGICSPNVGFSEKSAKSVISQYRANGRNSDFTDYTDFRMSYLTDRPDAKIRKSVKSENP